MGVTNISRYIKRGRKNIKPGGKFRGLEKKSRTQGARSGYKISLFIL